MTYQPPGLIEEICTTCNGSGEGMYGPPGTTTCRECRGGGLVWVEGDPEEGEIEEGPSDNENGRPGDGNP